MKLDRAYKKEIETTEKIMTDSIMIGKQKLMEKYMLEKKKEEKAEDELKEEEKNCNEETNQNGHKRTLPEEFKEDVAGEPEKKQKVEEEKPAAKPAFLSAQ